jgi:hypothetical protein
MYPGCRPTAYPITSHAGTYVKGASLRGRFYGMAPAYS